uniref:Uncharacterized protein n=1 Tax=Seriola dumerili TaxID=41447 RepID=A0A3B4T1N0_SERDU
MRGCTLCVDVHVASNLFPRKNKKERKHASPRVSVDSGYQQPTVSSMARALSPYTHRKMCQLSEDARQRLSHLQLGPHHFRKETESQPPFLEMNDTFLSIENARRFAGWEIRVGLCRFPLTGRGARLTTNL